VIRALPFVCLATTLVAGEASAQMAGRMPTTERPSSLSTAGTLPIQAPAMPPSAFQAMPNAPLPVLIEAGTGRLLMLPAAASTVLAADPKVARVQPASPTSIFLMGVASGRTTILATAEDGTAIAEYAVTVRGSNQSDAPGPAAGAPPPAGPAKAPRVAPAAIEAALRQMSRGAGSVRVRGVPNGYDITGTVASAAEAERMEALTRGFLTDEAKILNELEILSSVQVNLRVRVMEISRDVTRNLGFNWQALAATGNFVLGLKTGASAGYAVSSILGGGTSTLTAPSRLAACFSNPGKVDINSIIDALAQDRLATILAEPNLTAQSGETASFLAGGEFPVPVAAQISGAISIQFKQFGVSLGFVPTVLGPDRVNLRVRPEVSELSDNGAINLPIAGGTIRIPAVSVRRAETTIELGSGQSFAIAGLLQRNTSQTMDGVAGAGEIPVLGALFRSNAFRRAETELVVIVTPYLVRPVSDPRLLQGPTEGFKPATDLDRVLFMRQAARGAAGPRPAAAVPQDSGFLLE
jgi:pilus assembly protein CpaC